MPIRITFSGQGFQKGHRGFRSKESYRKQGELYKGRKLTEEWKENLSISSKASKTHRRFKKGNTFGFQEGDIPWNKGIKTPLSEEERQARSDRSSKLMVERIKNKGSIHSRGNAGWYKIAGKKYYFRSGWEVVYARYLQWLKNKEKIQKWEYEPKTFWFKKIKRGIRSYTPDFRIYNWTGTIEYHEVKGYMDSKSKTKIKRMAKYYPTIILIIIDEDNYKPIKEIERMFPEALKVIKN